MNFFKKIIIKKVFAQPPNDVCPPNDIVPCEAWSPEDILNFFISVRDFLLALGLILIVIFLVIGGVMFLTAGGDENKIKKAKTMLLFSIIGAFIILAAFVILNTIIIILRQRGFNILT